MVWECWQAVPIPITSLYQLWTIMVHLPSTSTDHTPPLSDHSDFGLKCWPIPEWFYYSTGYATNAVIDWECQQGVLINLQLDSTSSGYQWFAFLSPQWITLHPFRHPAEMLSLDLDPISIVLWRYKTISKWLAFWEMLMRGWRGCDRLGIELPRYASGWLVHT